MRVLAGSASCPVAKVAVGDGKSIIVRSFRLAPPLHGVYPPRRHNWAGAANDWAWGSHGFLGGRRAHARTHQTLTAHSRRDAPWQRCARSPTPPPSPPSSASIQVRLGYFVSLVGSFVLITHPLRHCVLEVLLGGKYAATKHAKARSGGQGRGGGSAVCIARRRGVPQAGEPPGPRQARTHARACAHAHARTATKQARASPRAPARPAPTHILILYCILIQYKRNSVRLGATHKMARNLREHYGDDMPLLSSHRRGGARGQPTPARYFSLGPSPAKADQEPLKAKADQEPPINK
jgi:hypothetical protein